MIEVATMPVDLEMRLRCFCFRLRRFVLQPLQKTTSLALPLHPPLNPQLKVRRRIPFESIFQAKSQSEVGLMAQGGSKRFDVQIS